MAENWTKSKHLDANVFNCVANVTNSVVFQNIAKLLVQGRCDRMHLSERKNHLFLERIGG